MKGRRLPVNVNRYAWWVTGRKADGKMVVLGPFMNEEERDEVLCSFQNDSGESHWLNTVDKARATSILKYKLFSATHDLDQSMQRVSHRI